MIPSPGKVSIRMNIIFTHMNHLKQLSSTNDLSAVLKPHIESVEKFELGFPVAKADGTGLRITRSQACTTAESGTNR